MNKRLESSTFTPVDPTTRLLESYRRPDGDPVNETGETDVPTGEVLSQRESRREDGTQAFAKSFLEASGK